jgi:hypothetical protein
MSKPPVYGHCDTFDCEFSATRHIVWGAKGGGGFFCADCADRLVLAGDTDLTFRAALERPG